MIVVDTHVLVWAMENDRSLGLEAAALIDEATASDGAYISAMTCWEVSMLVDRRKLEFRQGARAWLDEVLSQPGIFLAPVSFEIGVEAGSLPGRPHGDPCDRIIITTARILGCPLLTADGPILEYAANGHLTAIDARR
ncbi:MAG: type II toxin-antitoxin system VapC family toxin [Allosphingosinicella sp.]